MRLLAIDTTTSSTGAAIYTWSPEAPQGAWTGTFDAVTILEEDKRQAEALLPIMEAMMAKAGLSVQAMDAFACAQGPGSFTGLRIGVTMAKTMAQFAEKPVVGISSLAALAMEGEGPGNYLRVPVIDARANRIFAAAYKREGDGQTPRLQALLPESLYYQEDFLKQLTQELEAGPYAGVVFSGKGMKAHAFLTEEASFPYEVFQGQGSLSPVEAIARMAAARLDRGEADSVLDLTPHYLRKSQAELDRSRHENK